MYTLNHFTLTISRRYKIYHTHHSHTLAPSLPHSLTPSLPHIKPQTITHLKLLALSHPHTLAHMLTLILKSPHPSNSSHPHSHTLTARSHCSATTGGVYTDNHTSWNYIDTITWYQSICKGGGGEREVGGREGSREGAREGGREGGREGVKDRLASYLLLLAKLKRMSLIYHSLLPLPPSFPPSQKVPLDPSSEFT